MGADWKFFNEPEGLDYQLGTCGSSASSAQLPHNIDKYLKNVQPFREVFF